MSDDTGLEIDTRQAVKSVEELKTSLDMLVTRMKVMGEQAGKSFVSLDEDALSALGAVRSQAQALADSAKRVTMNLSTELDTRLALVRQHNLATQNAYEQAHVIALAQQKQMTLAELEAHKAAGATLLAADKQRLLAVNRVRREIAEKAAADQRLLDAWMAAQDDNEASKRIAKRIAEEEALQQALKAREEKSAIANEARRAAQNTSLWEGQRAVAVVKQSASESLAIKKAALAEEQALAAKRVSYIGTWEKLLFEQEQKGIKETAAARLSAHKQHLDILNAQVAAVQKAEAQKATAFKVYKTSNIGTTGQSLGGAEVVGAYSAYNALTANSGKHVSALGQLNQGLKNFVINSNDAHSAARGLSAGFGGLFLTWGAMVPILAGSAISYGMAAIVKSGAEVQNTLTQIAVLAGATGKEIAGMSAQMLDLARSGPFGPREIAEAMKTLSLAGLKASETMEALPEVLNFSVAGTTSIKLAAETLTTIGSTFGITAKNYGYISDVIAKAAAESKSSIEGMSEAFKTASVISGQYGVALEDVAVGLSLLANAGITGTAAGTAMRNMYADISGRTPKVAAALKQLGVDATDSFGKMRDQASLFKDVMVKLAEYDPKSQSKLLQDIFSERGAKEAIAIIQNLRKEADETSTSVGNAYDELAEKIQNAAGFTAIAAAQMSLTPLNQMKSVSSALEATLVETFTSIQPYLVEISSRLKEAFGSEEFKSSIRELAVGIAKVTMAVVDNLKMIVEAVTAYFTFKGAITAIGGVLTLVATGAQAAAAGVGALGIAMKVLSNSTPILAVISGLVTVGATAWGLYAMNSKKASEEVAKYSGSTAEQLLEKLDQEIDRLDKVNAARALGISLQEMEMKNSYDKSLNEDSPAVLAAQKALEDFNKVGKQQQIGYSRNRGLSARQAEAEVTKAQTALEKDLTNALTKQGEVRLTLQQRMDVMASRYAEQKAAAKLETDKIRNISGGTKSYSTPDTEAETAARRVAAAEKTAADQRMQAVIKEYSDLETAHKKSTDNELAILDSKHKNKLISEGTFAAAQLGIIGDAETDAQALRQVYTDKLLDMVVNREAAIAAAMAKTKPGSAEYEQLSSELAHLGEVWDSFMRKVEGANDAALDIKLKRMAVAADNAAGKLRELDDAAAKFWQQDAIEAAASVDKLTYSVDIYSQAMETAATKANAKYAKQLLDLQKAQSDAANALQDFQAHLKESGLELTVEEAQTLNQLKATLSKADKLIAAHGDKAADGVSRDMANALSVKVAESQRAIISSLTDAIYTGFKEGGESGVKAIRAVIEREFVEKPIKVAIEALLTGSGSGGSSQGLLGGLMKDMAMQASGLGSTMSNILYGGSSIMGASKWFTGFGNSVVNAINLVGGKLYNLGAEKVGEYLTSSTFAVGGDLAKNIDALGAGVSYLAAAVAASEGKWGQAIGTAIGAQFGPIGSAIGGWLGSVVDRGFGGGSEYTTGQGLEGTFSGNQFAGQQYQTWYNPGSWWGQSSNGRNTYGLDKKLVDALSNSFTLVKVQATGFGEALGLNTQAVQNYSRYISINTEGGAEATRSALTETMKIIADEMAAKLISSTFQKEGERLADTLARLATNLTSVNAIMFLLDKNAMALSEAGGGAASALIDLFGGLDAFATASDNYYQKFFTEAEKRADTVSNLEAAFAKLNMTMPQTNTGFRALVTAQDLTTEAGRNNYLALMGLVDAFASLTDGAGTASDAITALAGLTENDFATRVAYERFKGRLLNGESTVGLSGIPGFATGGQFDGGWRVVGEDGPEIEHTGPSAIYNNSQSLFDTSALVAEIQALRAEVSNLRYETRAIVTNTGRVAKLEDKWDAEGTPPVRT